MGQQQSDLVVGSAPNTTPWQGVPLTSSRPVPLSSGEGQSSSRVPPAPVAVSWGGQALSPAWPDTSPSFTGGVGFATSPTVQLPGPVKGGWSGSRVLDGVLETEPVSASQQTIPTIIKWACDGSIPRQVEVCGSWDGWNARIPLSRSQGDFSTILSLEPGLHLCKFVVDGQWCCNPNQTMTGDASGNVNNIVEVSLATNQEPERLVPGRQSPDGEYGQILPDNARGDVYSKDPPTLPAHLGAAPLNRGKSHEDSTLLPVPHHVMLNHLYVQEQDGVILQAMTHRFRNKFVTLVMVKPMPVG